jgi:hypothetical protein
VKIHKTIRMTPAMALGVSDKTGTIDGFAGRALE